MNANHSFFSTLAFNIAENNLGKTSKNPSVGCVIVRNNSVISSGVTSINGRPHAEFNALNKDLDFKNSIMYVTLEPCAHYGVTPPCTNIIINKKIKKVFYSFDDPDKNTYKKAKKIFKKKKIYFKKMPIKNDFYKGYFLNKIKNFPLIDAKIALSKDNYSINKKSKWITNHKSRKVAHLIRSKYDCILSTSKSINKDNSLLNCRIDGLDKNQPDLIIIDLKLKLKRKLKIFQQQIKRKVYIFTSSGNKKKISFFKKKKIKIIRIKSLKSKKDFHFFFKKVFKIGKTRILIESGLIFLNELLRFKLINDLYLFRSAEKLKNLGYNNTRIKYLNRYSFKDLINVNLKGDKLFKIRIK